MDMALMDMALLIILMILTFVCLFLIVSAIIIAVAYKNRGKRTENQKKTITKCKKNENNEKNVDKNTVGINVVEIK